MFIPLQQTLHIIYLYDLKEPLPVALAYSQRLILITILTLGEND